MAIKMAMKAVAALLALTGSSHAYWRMSCSVIQEGRIDPIVSPGKAASHAHKIAGASNIGLSSTFESLQTSNCTSCEIQADKSAYWTPILYYEHANGSFEEVTAPGMAVYYLGRGDTTSDIKPFPSGFRMLSGDPLARSYNTSAKTYNNVRPIADRVSFACLDTAPQPETPGMSDTSCVNGLRAQVHFQSCWNGVDLYKPDNSHVAYMSDIDNGVCPPDYPVHFMHLFFEVLYSVANINQDGGKFVFSNGDPTGFGFHGDFFNGWDNTVLTSAIQSCGKNNGNPSGSVAACPAFTSDIQNFAQTCPQQTPIIKEPVSGLIDKLPGCITITDGPEEATDTDFLCGSGTVQPGLIVQPGLNAVAKRIVKGTEGTVGSVPTIGTAAGTVVGTTAPTGTLSRPAKSVNASCSTSHKSIYVRSTGTRSGFVTAASASVIPFTTIPIITTAPAPIASSTGSIINAVNGYAAVGCFEAATLGSLILAGDHYTDVESMTVQSCTSYCEARGLGVAGLGNAQECYCGVNNLGLKTNTTSCNMPCKGNAAELCGGPSALSIWESG